MSDERLATIEGHGDVRRVRAETLLDAPLTRVWEAITDVEQLRLWWPDWHPGGTLEPREGGRVVLGDGSWIDGRVKVWAPPLLLEFTWRESACDEAWFEPASRSLLRIELLPHSRTSTHLALTQFMPTATAPGGAAGWHQFLERLRSLLRAGKVDSAPDRFSELLPVYEGMLNANSVDAERTEEGRST